MPHPNTVRVEEFIAGLPIEVMLPDELAKRWRLG